AATAVPLVWLAAHAACTSAVRSHWLPLVVLPPRRLPALSWLPGHSPAHDDRCPDVGNFVMSVPTSATTTSATRLPTPAACWIRPAPAATGAITSAIRAP